MDGQSNPPFDPNALSFLVMLTNGIKPLHLSATRSINLDRVINYESVEKLDENEKPIPILDEKGKPTGENVFVPMVFLAGGDSMELEPEENEIFRDIWNIYAELATSIFSAAKMFIPQTPAAETQQGG